MINFKKNKPTLNVISGTAAGGTLGFIVGNVPGAIIGGAIGQQLGKLKDRNPNGLITKKQLENYEDKTQKVNSFRYSTLL